MEFCQDWFTTLGHLYYKTYSAFVYCTFSLLKLLIFLLVLLIDVLLCEYVLSDLPVLGSEGSSFGICIIHHYTSVTSKKLFAHRFMTSTRQNEFGQTQSIKSICAHPLEPICNIHVFLQTLYPFPFVHLKAKPENPHFSSSSAGQFIVQFPFCRHGHELPSRWAKTWDRSLMRLLCVHSMNSPPQAPSSSSSCYSVWGRLREWEEDGGSWLRVWAAAHWRLSLAGALASAAGRGGASHRQRRMMRWQMWREAELLFVEG